MRITLAGITIAVFIAMANIAHAETCAYQDGGYCLSSIAGQTAQKLGTPAETAVWDKSEWDEAGWINEGILGGTAYLNYYENIWDQMIKNGKASMQNREKAFEKAKRAGGTKIGGVNLVVLSVTTLQQMIDNKTLTKGEAQGILDQAKMTPSPNW